MSKFYDFDQNNPGGKFHIDDKKGLGVRVWIEANNIEEAIDRAEDIGIYFNGVADGRDCSCCDGGDRWHEPNEKDTVEIDRKNDFVWYHTVYIHRADGTIERIRKGD